MPDKNKRRIFLLYIYICPLAEVWTALLTKEMRVFFLSIRSAAFASHPPIFGWRNEREENWVHTFLMARGIVAYHHVKLRIEEKKAIQCAHTKHTIQVYKNVYQQPDDNDGSFRYYVVFSFRSLSLSRSVWLSEPGWSAYARHQKRCGARRFTQSKHIVCYIVCIYFSPVSSFFCALPSNSRAKKCVRAAHFFLFLLSIGSQLSCTDFSRSRYVCCFGL